MADAPPTTMPNGEVAAAPPILPYRGVVGVFDVPDWCDEAERLIALGRGPDDLVPALGHNWVAYWYFANAMARRHPRIAPAGPCAFCSGRPANGLVRYSWCAGLIAAAEARTVAGHDQAVMFDTHHPACEACRRRAMAAFEQYARWSRESSWQVATALGIALAWSVVIMWVNRWWADRLDRLGVLTFAFCVLMLVPVLRRPRRAAAAPQAGPRMPPGVWLRGAAAEGPESHGR